MEFASQVLLCKKIAKRNRAENLLRLHDEALLQALHLLQHLDGHRVRALELPPPVHVHRVLKLFRQGFDLRFPSTCHLVQSNTITLYRLNHYGLQIGAREKK